MAVRGYCRSSRPPRNGTGREGALGIESQRAAILERFPDAVVYEDAARSGRNAKRPGLQRMLSDLVAGDLLVVVRLDRLARCTRLAMALELRVEVECRCRVLSLAGEGTSADGPPDPVAVFQRRVAAAAAELQAAQAGAATAAALAVRRSRGFTSNGRAVFGWRVGADGRVEEAPDEQATMTVVREFTRGRLWHASAREVAARLNELGRLNRERPWTAHAAWVLLKRMAAREQITP